jgi:hypothetical protein
MERPISIVWFERCYLGCVVVGVINTIVSWNATLAKIAETPATAQFGPSFMPDMMIGVGVLSVLISLLLWSFTARKGSVVTKWIITVLFVLGILGLLMSIVQGTLPQGLPAILAIVAWVLDAIAVFQLFRPDTKVWFGEAQA